MAFEFACLVDSIPSGRGRVVEIGERVIGLFRDGAEVFALANRCPHSGGSLGEGWCDSGEVVCPLHGWRFRLEDGRCTMIRGEWVRSFRLEIRGNEVWVEV